jgi:hypothetical protein
VEVTATAWVVTIAVIVVLLGADPVFGVVLGLPRAHPSRQEAGSAADRRSGS